MGPVKEVVVNHEENMFRVGMEAKGFKVYQHGWPDFLVVGPDGKAFAVEVKSAHEKVRPDQHAIHAILRQCGISVYVSRGNFEKLATVEGRQLIDDNAHVYLEKRLVDLKAKVGRAMEDLERYEMELKGATVILSGKAVPVDLERNGAARGLGPQGETVYRRLEGPLGPLPGRSVAP